jgi:catechol 2,3-dioxygenase-like lactoylglutathione lyase family enzyme
MCRCGTFRPARVPSSSVLKKVDRILVRVESLDGAVSYYRDVIGLKLVKQDARLASFRMLDGQTELVVHCDADLPDQAMYYLVESVKALYARREELKLKFAGPPSPVSRGFRATVKDPFGNVMLLLDRSAEGGGEVVEDAKAPGGLFAGVEQRTPVKRELLIEVYERTARTADDLPYTPHFETLYRDYVAKHGEPKPTRGEVWRHLLNLRKGGKLPKLGPARSQPPEITAEERERLREMLGADIGKRDRLPYTERFDRLVDEFNGTQRRKISPHLVWRLVATLAK